MQDNNIIQEAIDCLKRLHKENTELKAENEQLKEEFKRLKESECVICKYANIGDKYQQTLQEIKARIPEDYKIYQWYEDVIHLITKAESEG